MEEEAPRAIEIPVPDDPYVDIQKEEQDVLDDLVLDDPADLVDPMEPVEPSKRPRDAPPTKRRPT